MRKFAAIDFETANYQPTSICSVGVVVVDGEEILHRIHRLVAPTPNYYVRRFTQQIHGIGYEDTFGEPNFLAVWQQVMPYIEGLPLVAHNKSFDQRVLRLTLEAYGWDWPGYNVHCTLRAAQRLFPKPLVENHRLPTICHHLGIAFDQHHNALADAEACARIAMQILR